MTGSLAHRAETARLARVLGVDPDELGFLGDAPVAALAELRVTVLDRLLERNRDEFERAVSLADKIPRGLAAALAQSAMGPVLGGRAAALLSADMAADLAGRLPAEFLADVATHVDLRHVGPLIGGIPTDTMAAAGRVLIDRQEWIVLSAFVGHVPEEKLEVLLGLFEAEALLRSAFVIEDAGQLDPAMALLPDARLDEVFAGAHEHDLWPEAMALADHIGDTQARRIVAAIDRLPDDHVDALLAAAHAHDLWVEAMGMIAHLDHDARDGGGIVRAVGRMPPAHFDDLLRAADQHALWAQLITLAGQVLEAEESDTLIAAIARMETAQQARLAAALNNSQELRAAAAGLIARAPAELRSLLHG